MPKIALITILAILIPAVCFGQGILESVLGPGGLGVWNGVGANQFNYQQFQGQQPNQPMQQGYEQGQNPYAQPNQGYAPPPAYPNYNQQGVYSDWQNYQQPSNAPQGPPPVSYTAPPQQGPPPNQNQVPVAQGRQPQPPPGQYPSYPQSQQFDENLPAGAVRITTQTPDGTTVQYYPPQGEDMENQPISARKPKQRRGQVAPTPARVKKPAQEQRTSAGAHEGQGTSIAMPHPVEIPQGQDPRSGWNSFNRGAPTAPPAQ
ncbi:MAG: hypothetical protein M0T73_06605 [Deltaproteobacteria bacterium]|nr:hypothetical protein [Deltaproteobacteria bacterium]